MRKTAIYLLISILLGVATSACNTDGDSASYTSGSYSSTAVTAFSLKRNKKLLSNLDSVFFSIDLVSAQIFNADSLPFGTNVSRLQVEISTNNCSEVKLTVPQPDGSAKEINYLTNSTDSIDFSHGPVSLLVRSADGLNERVYQLRVNVHQVEPDLLYWNETASHGLPTSLSAPVAQKSVRFADKAFTLTADASGAYCMASTADPAADGWQMDTPTFPADVDVASLAATSDALYVLSRSGELLTSADGATWTSTGEQWLSILGGYEARLLGVKTDGSVLTHVSYPPSSSTPVADDFPVSGMSPLVSASTRWALAPQVIGVGGTTADGTLTGATWAYDGKNWMRFNSDQLPASEGRTLFAYSIVETDTLSWRQIPRDVLLSFGGRLADSAADKSVYISYDLGLNWKKADEMLQLPDKIPAMAFAQALVFDSTLTAAGRSASDGWEYVAPRVLPSWYAVASAGRSEKWTCPYIYLFGGTDGSALYPTLWRGVITRLTFQPLR